MARKTKLDLEMEIRDLKSEMQAQSEISMDLVNKLRVKEHTAKLTFMKRIELREQVCLKQIQHAMEDCYDKTGRQPDFKHVEINRPSEGTRLRVQLPKACFDNELSKDYPQTNAVKELIDWCMANGEWTSRKMCKSWIIDRLRNSRI